MSKKSLHQVGRTACWNYSKSNRKPRDGYKDLASNVLLAAVRSAKKGDLLSQTFLITSTSDVYFQILNLNKQAVLEAIENEKFHPK